MSWHRLALILAAIAAAVLLLFASRGAGAAQPRFATPERAAQALRDAVQRSDVARIEAILGPASFELVHSGDEAQDMAARARFAAASEAGMRIEPRGRDRAILHLGADDRPFPFPIVRGRGGWAFDAHGGAEAVIAGRMERNQVAAMQALLTLLQAQRDYMLAAHDGAGPGVPAARIASTPGRHDGLYWAPSREEGLSPLGTLFTLANADGTRAEARPYHGYLFRSLAGPGGTAFVAWPAHYLLTGVRTYVATPDGSISSRDFGRGTAKHVQALRSFAAEGGWRREAVAPWALEPPGTVRVAMGRAGCTFCHRDAPAPREAGDAPPPAPSFRDIAARYRGDPAAQERLVRIVVEGSDPSIRHWKDRLDFTAMTSNAPGVGPEEARAYVRWILARP